MLTGSMVLIWTLGAEDERSLWPNWFRWSSSLGRKLGGMGIDLDGDTVLWHIDLQRWGWRMHTIYTTKHQLLTSNPSFCIGDKDWRRLVFFHWGGGDGELTQWSRMAGGTDRPQTQVWFPLRRSPPGSTGDAQRTLTLATSWQHTYGRPIIIHRWLF